MRLSGILISVITVIVVSCNGYEREIKADSLKMSVALFRHDSYLKPVQVYLFRYSVCIDDCNAPESIIYSGYSGDSLKLKLGLVLNCIGDFVLELKTSGDTLDLKISPRPEIFYRPDGKADTLISVTDCDCFFTVNIGLKNLSYRFKAFLVNGVRPGTLKREGMLHE